MNDLILKQLSEADLQALANNDFSGLSEQGLKVLAGETGPRFQHGAFDSALQGATFGWADEIGAAKDTALGRGPYRDNLRDRGVSRTMYERENPGKAIAAELTGAAGVSLLPGGLVFNAVRGPAVASRVGPTVARYGGAAVGGGTSGAITGAGVSEPGQRTKGAIQGGALGTVLGPAGALALRGATKTGQVVADATAGIPGAQRVGSFVGRVSGATVDSERRAQEKLLQAFQRDELTPEQIMAATRAMGAPNVPQKPETLIERAGTNTLGLADTASLYPGVSRRMAGDLAAERMGGQGERIGADLSQAFRVQGDPVKLGEALAAKRATDAAPLYQQAYQRGVGIVDPRINQFMGLPAFQQAYGRARRLAQYDGIELPKDPRGLQQFDLQTLDYVKRGLDDVVFSGQRQGSLGNTELNKIRDARSAFVQTLDEIVPEYAQARAAWAGPTAMKEALEAGQDALRLDPRELQAALRSMSPAEVEQFKIGALDGLRRKIASMDDGRDVVRSVYGSPAKRETLAALVGPDEFAKLEQQFLREKAIRRTDDTIRGNSRTAQRQAGMADLEADTGLVPAILNQGPIRGPVNYVLRSSTGVAQPTADKLGPMLFSTSRESQEKILRDLMDLDKFLRGQAAGVGTGAGTTAGMGGAGLLDR